MDEASGEGVRDRHWLRPWAATFDLISSEYGWSDERILDLTLGRMRQIREVIMSRRDADWRRQVHLEEAKLRHLVAATMAAANNRKGAAQAGEITLIEPTEDEAAAVKKDRVASTAAVSQMFPAGSGEFAPMDMDEFNRRVEEEKARRRAAGLEVAE